ncbi:endonuclease/exonuclease/phosphatase family protein [Aeoliella mucimassa]|uniref:endonuclease/exonuclease/phosphatase family protein n=1 Tax=Aeoliella mucimassa TaxID=2527972 RepID=UPI0018D43981|nr:endonuclease/exonuclease/phosphatase family protein [Aeoliella mucimassa]
MQRLFSTAMMVAILGGGGWMFYKGLHLEDIKQILVTGSTAVSQLHHNGDTAGGGSPQPTPTSINLGQQNQSTIRIASFNIQVFGEKKASDTEAMTVIGNVFRNFDIVAVQEIRNKDELFVPKFVQNLNQFTGRTFDYKLGPRLGNTTSKEQYAFIFDTAKIMVSSKYVFTIQDPKNLLHREPYVGLFTVRGVPDQDRFTFMLVNVHTDPDVAKEEMDALAQVFEVLRRQGLGEDDIIMLGDFNTAVPMDPNSTSRVISQDDLAALGRIPDIYPVIQNQPTNVARNRLHDNILFHRPSTTEFTGQGGVFDFEKQFNLTPEQAKRVSDHFPVWAEFSIYEAGISNQMAIGATNTTR